MNTLSKATKLIEDIAGEQHLQWIPKLIHDSQKFLLGDINSFPDKRQIDLKMPYPVTLLEYKTMTTSGTRKDEMLLCVEQDGNSVKFVPFQYSNNSKKWKCINCTIDVNSFDPCDFSISQPVGVKQYPQEFISTMLEHFVGVCRVFLSVLNCNNVDIEKIDPPSKLQKKRIKTKKRPFYSFHVLAINHGKGKTRDIAGGFAGKSSPRVHFRRGHIRRFSNGTTTWVSQCVVGDKSLGFVDKIYEVKC